jgi:hypothetical protein
MIFIPTLKPQAQGGVRFSDFNAPPCADFRTFLSAIDFGALLARLARLPSFSNFKLACPLCPPRFHHAASHPHHTPAPPRRTWIWPFKITPIHFDAQGARQSNGAFDYP